MPDKYYLNSGDRKVLTTNIEDCVDAIGYGQEKVITTSVGKTYYQALYNTAISENDDPNVSSKIFRLSNCILTRLSDQAETYIRLGIRKSDWAILTGTADRYNLSSLDSLDPSSSYQFVSVCYHPPYKRATTFVNKSTNSNISLNIDNILNNFSVVADVSVIFRAYLEKKTSTALVTDPPKKIDPIDSKNDEKFIDFYDDLTISDKSEKIPFYIGGELININRLIELAEFDCFERECIVEEAFLNQWISLSSN
ncbi:uncharacterized protein ASCRUDRAFT_77023 [Ascoidea rubescens DSM 1968]|uniref:Uncharacterized protein n=1 Tax=Ascoidea rubescens DSM 1968 TaxID=1344418 RepID=A0A1D2VDG2_9ASCO|nr:hypothetical protein ASCRUDRAFT_77023 [Ascoidea rubescens DSM 1968]ODV59676.1 hypothetical protein ASCRUDRAFT_77023 [Ascoidea rubescens DSM 1968]